MSVTPFDLINTEQGIVAVNIDDFITMSIPPRTCLMSPWLPSGGLTLIYAYRGVGKTFFSLNIAYAVATGGTFLGWQCTEPKRVLYIDGEMPASDMQERILQIRDTNQGEPIRFKLITPDFQKYIIPNLATDEGQQELESFTNQADLIVVDNISTLCRTGKENDSDQWTPVQQWALKMRSEGRSVLFIHHANKNGGQRGTSGREDVLDTVIALKKPQGSTPEEGANFQVHFEKNRGFSGVDAQPFNARMTIVDGKQHWLRESIADTTFARCVKLHNEGHSQAEIADKIGIHKSNVSRHIKRANEEGLISVKTSDS